MDLGFLAPLYERPGPFATVYLDTTRSSEDAAHAIDLRWKEQRHTLAEHGADEATLAALDATAGQDRGVAGPHGQVLVGAGGQVVVERVLPAPPRRELAHWGSLPHLMPMLAQLAETVPYVLVRCDRVGADIEAYGGFGQPTDSAEVDGGTLHIRKVKPGGWAHKRYQQRAENLWDRNAQQVAEETDRIVRESGARVLAVTGDVRAREALTEHLGPRSRGMLAELDEGGRAAGADEDSLRAALERLLAEVSVRDRQATLAQFEEQRGRHERAVEGLPATVQALQRAQVDTLVLVDDPSSTARLFVGDGPEQLGMRREDLTALGVENAQEERADAALVRALAGTGAALLVVPGGADADVRIADGIGALLRYADASTPS